MASSDYRRIMLLGGITGTLSVLLYILAISVPQVFLPENPEQVQISLTFFVAAIWPLFGIANSYALYRWIAWERAGPANSISFLFAVVGFGLVTAVMAIQLAAQFAIHEYALHAVGFEQELWRLVLKAVRTVDLGLDVVWDLFLGSSMVVVALPALRHSQLGVWWAAPSALFGALMVGLNVATFPWPPSTRGLFDIGPAVGVYGLLLSLYMLKLGLSSTR